MMNRYGFAIVTCLAVAGASCGQSSTPPAPSPVTALVRPADFSGIWQGQYKITTCSGERDCWFRIGSTRPYVLRLSQAGATVAGVLEAMSFVVDVSGEVTKDGQVTLTGSRPGTTGWDGMWAVTVRLTGLRLDTTNGLSGDLSYTLDQPVGREWPFPHVAHGGTLLGATRGALPAVSPAALAAYEGTWAGTYVVGSCHFEGWASCWPEVLDGAYPLTLHLRVNGTALEGDLSLPGGTRLPVIGSVSAAGLAVQGTESHVVSGGTDITTLGAWSVTRDPYDRLTGTFEYERRWARTNGAPYTSSYRVRLAGVTRQP